MFVGFLFCFLTLFFSFHSALTLVLHRRQAQINLLLSNFWPPWHEGVCFLLGWRHALQMVCPALPSELRKATSGQAGPFCPMPPPPSPLLTESATQLTLYLLSSTHFSKEKEWSTLKSELEICPKMFLCWFWVSPLSQGEALTVSSVTDWFVRRPWTFMASLRPSCLASFFGFPFFDLKFGFAVCVLYLVQCR